MEQNKVKYTPSGGRIYEQTKIDDKTRTDWSGFHINYGYRLPERTLKQRLISFITLGRY
jgi:hypothetical protein